MRHNCRGLQGLTTGSFQSGLSPSVTKTYPSIHPLHQCGFGRIQTINDDNAVYSNNTPFHSQCTLQFANCFRLISQQTKSRQGRVLIALYRRGSKCDLSKLHSEKRSQDFNPGPLSPHTGLFDLDSLHYFPTHLLQFYSSLLPPLSISVSPKATLPHPL